MLPDIDLESLESLREYPDLQINYIESKLEGELVHVTRKL